MRQARFRIGATSAALAAALAGCGTGQATQTTSSTLGSTLPVAKLQKAGITLTDPKEPETITQQKALSEVHGTAQDVALRHVLEPGRHIDTDAWVIALDPHAENMAAGPPGSSPAPQTFSVVLIDAHTGAWIEQVSGS